MTDKSKGLTVTLQVDGTQLTDEVKDLLASLTDEQKRELATQLLQRTMTDTNSKFMQDQAIQRALEEMNTKRPGRDFKWGVDPRDYGSHGPGLYAGGGGRYIEHHEREEFQKIMQHLCNVNEFFYVDVLQAMRRLVEKRIEEEILKSDMIAKAMDEMIEGFKKNVPTMVQNAMTQIFYKQTIDAMQQGMHALMASSMNESMIKQLEQRFSQPR